MGNGHSLQLSRIEHTPKNLNGIVFPSSLFTTLTIYDVSNQWYSRPGLSRPIQNQRISTHTPQLFLPRPPVITSSHPLSGQPHTPFTPLLTGLGYQT